MDLLLSNGFNTILVVVDWFSVRLFHLKFCQQPWILQRPSSTMSSGTLGFCRTLCLTEGHNLSWGYGYSGWLMKWPMNFPVNTAFHRPSMCPYSNRSLILFSLLPQDQRYRLYPKSTLITPSTRSRKSQTPVDEAASFNTLLTGKGIVRRRDPGWTVMTFSNPRCSRNSTSSKLTVPLPEVTVILVVIPGCLEMAVARGYCHGHSDHSHSNTPTITRIQSTYTCI